MVTKNKYDTFVVFLYSVGKEKILPAVFRKLIPSATIAGWRKINYAEYLGHEFRSYFEESFDNAELNYRYKNLKNGLRSVTRSWVMLKDILIPVIKKGGRDTLFQRKILIAIKYMQSFIGLERALRMIGISKTLYQEWILRARFDCSDSFVSLCAKRHPHQLGMREVQKIKKMLTDPQYDHWPIVSIASLAMRKGNLVACLYTWYKYSKMLGITKKMTKKDRKTVGLISTIPNEYLHVDTTYYWIEDGKKICITFVMDNYSKMILGYAVAEKLSFDLVKRALSHALETIAKHPDQLHMHLVADGGKENHNKEVDKFIHDLSGHKITKIQSLKDIRFSNSPVEAVHRTVKGRYLRNRKFSSLEDLCKFLDWMMIDYNTLRPHYKHRPYTPHEIYFKQTPKFDINKRMRSAMKKRVANNLNTKCIECRASRIKKGLDPSEKCGECIS